MFATPAITAIVIAVLGAVAFVGGFAVNDWRNGKEMQRLKSDNAILEASNDKCATDIFSVREALTALAGVIEDREKAAEAAMVEAKPEAEKHTRAATVITQLPPVPQDQQCATIEREQIEYINTRRDSNETSVITNHLRYGDGLPVRPFQQADYPNRGR